LAISHLPTWPDDHHQGVPLLSLLSKEARHVYHDAVTPPSPTPGRRVGTFEEQRLCTISHGLLVTYQVSLTSWSALRSDLLVVSHEAG
jgi:hypothetical protein